MFEFLESVNGRRVFKEGIKQCIKDKRNQNLKPQILIYSAWTIVDDDGLTLLHLCATYGNRDLAEFLVQEAPDIEARTKTGHTPLSLAIVCNNFGVAEILLQAGAEVHSETRPHDSALRMAMMNSTSVPARIFKLMYASLKMTYTTRELSDLLKELECRLDNVVAMRNSALTRLYLGTKSVISRAESHSSIRVAVALADVSNLRVLMYQGEDPSQRVRAFFGRLLALATTPTRYLVTVRLFADYLSDWNSWLPYPVDCVKKIFERADESVLRTFMEYDIHESIKSQSGIDVLAHLYANRSVGVADMIKHLLSKRHPIEFGDDGKPGLHHAVYECALENVKVHLDMGESPDAIDRRGRPALFEAFRSPQDIAAKEQCVLLLLLGCADVQIVDDLGQSVFNLCRSKDAHHLIRIVVAHLVMRESLGLVVGKNIKYEITKNEFLMSCYTQCREQLGMMKAHLVIKDLTAYRCVAERTTTVLSYMTDEAMENMPTHRRFVASLNTYFVALFDRLLDAIKIHKEREAVMP